MNKTDQLALKPCYFKAWKAFSKGWIPICLVAGFLMMFNWIPKQLAHAESSALSQTLGQISVAIEQNDLEQIEGLILELNESAWAYTKKLTTFMLYALPLTALFTILLLCASVRAVKGQPTRYPLSRIFLIAAINLALAILKVALAFLLFPFGLFIYIKLYFVSLFMLEEGHSPSRAIQESWTMTAGNFWPLFGMVTINGTLQMALIPTVVGLIPATGFANTTRAAAYSMLRQKTND